MRRIQLSFADGERTVLNTSTHQETAQLSRELLLLAAVPGTDRRSELLDEVVRMHLWLAESVARRFQHRGEEYDDLVQVARAGLVEAARRFDPVQGEFLAFAVPTVTGVVKRHFRDHGWLVRPPRHTQELVAAIRREWADLAQELGSEPTDLDLAGRLGETERDVATARQAGQGYSATSLDALTAVGAPVPSEQSEHDMEQSEVRMMVATALEGISEDERVLLRLRFVEQRSQSDIAERIGTSQMQVSRMLARLFAKLRKVLEDGTGAVDILALSGAVAGSAARSSGGSGPSLIRRSLNNAA